MAGPNDLREVFPTTRDRVTGAGVDLDATVEGQSSAAKQGAIGFAFKDANGNVVLPQLTPSGQLPVTLDTPGLRSRAHGRMPGAVLGVPGSGDYTGFVTVLSIPAVAASGYGDMAAKVACRRGAIFELCYQDAGSLVILDASIVDAGQYTSPLGLGPAEDVFTVPASAISPAFIVRAGNFMQASDLHATLALTSF